MDHREFPHCGWKKGIVTFPLSHQKSFPTCLNLSTVFVCVLMLLGNSCLNAGNVCLNAGYSCTFFLQKKCIKCHNVLEMFEHVQNWFWKTSQFIWVAPNRSHQTCSWLWAPAPGHILRSAHVPTFTVPFQFLTAFKLKQELSVDNHELNSCLQISYRNSRLNWIARLQSIYLPIVKKSTFSVQPKISAWMVI